MDRIDLSNTLQTIGWSQALVNGFEPLAYGAALSLIHYRDHLTQAGRLSWARANSCLSDAGQSGVRKTPQGIFLSWVNQLRLQTFGSSFDDESVNRAVGLSATPWALSDPEFQYCMNYINTGKIPDDDEFRAKFVHPNESAIEKLALKEVKDQIGSYLDRGGIAITGAVLDHLFRAVKSPLTSTGSGAAAQIAWIGPKMLLDHITRRDLIGRYRIDERRRVCLAAKSLSSYKSIA